MDWIDKAIEEKKKNFDEAVQVENGIDGYKVLHNNNQVYFAHHLNDGAREEANREAKILINKLKAESKTVYIYLQ